jgi:hypothetical protein
MRARRFRQLALLVLLSAGCASGPDVTDTLERYRVAMVRDDPKAAYALLTEETRRRWPFSQFERRWKETPMERAQQAQALAAADKIVYEAQVSVAGGSMVLRAESGKNWWVASGALPMAGAATPQAALRALIRAVELGDYRAFLRTLTQSKRERIERALRERLTKLRELADQPLEATGDQLVIQYDPDLKIWLRKEQGQWRVDDVE